MPKGMKAKPITVGGVTAIISEHCKMRGLKYTTVTGRIREDWTIEQALGLAPKPVRPRGKPDAKRWSNLQDALPLDTPLNNMWKAMAGDLTAEEYLRREGVPANGYVLSSRDH